MADDVLGVCASHGLVGVLPPCKSAQTMLLDGQGANAPAVQPLEGWSHGLSAQRVRFAVEHEYACTVEDVLARRSRLLFLDARAARELAPLVAKTMEDCGVAAPRLAEFEALADKYLQVP